MINFALASLALAGPSVDSALAEAQPVKIWISNDRQFRPGNAVKVQIETGKSGYLLVLHFSPSGQLSVLFPVAPADDNLVQADRRYEVRDGDGSVSFVASGSGPGLIYSALSEDPWQLESVNLNGAWDYSTLTMARDTKDPEADITALVQKAFIASRLRLRRSRLCRLRRSRRRCLSAAVLVVACVQGGLLRRVQLRRHLRLEHLRRIRLQLGICGLALVLGLLALRRSLLLLRTLSRRRILSLLPVLSVLPGLRTRRLLQLQQDCRSSSWVCGKSARSNAERKDPRRFSQRDRRRRVRRRQRAGSSRPRWRPGRDSQRQWRSAWQRHRTAVGRWWHPREQPGEQQSEVIRCRPRRPGPAP